MLEDGGYSGQDNPLALGPHLSFGQDLVTWMVGVGSLLFHLSRLFVSAVSMGCAFCHDSRKHPFTLILSGEA